MDKPVEDTETTGRSVHVEPPERATPDNAGEASGSAGAPAPEKPPRRGPKRILIALVVLAALCGGAWAGYQWWTVWRFVESTDDAYVKADIVGISAQVSGLIERVPVEENATVAAGDVLVEIDDRAYRADLETARAQIDAAEAAIANVKAQRELQKRSIAIDKADLASAQAQYAFAQSDAERIGTLRQGGTSTERQFQQAQTTLSQADAAVAKAQAQIARDEQQLNVIDSEERQRRADLENAQAARQVAELDLEHTVVHAPTAGIVGNLEAREGAYVSPGMRMMSVVPVRQTYVEANFKETQIAEFGIGMPVTLEVDMLGGREIEGTIASLAPASGSEFAVIPPQNATGNFTKIVQRVPVRIRLDPDTVEETGLKPGTSVVASVNIRAARQ